MDLQIGSTVGDYQVLGVLGAGGMGSVYQVRNLISDRVEALKVLLPDLTGNPELAERFQREIKVQGSLDHPNIAQLHTAFRNGNQLLMVMEFVDGITLEQKLKDGPLPVLLALDCISQVLSALEFAHDHGVVHRDIKPANMILTRTGVVKLMDFGIAKATTTDHKLTNTGTTMGSLYYMSPEQIQGSASLDSRADLYSVGVTLYQLVTGKRPFDGDSQYAIMAAHLEKTPVPPVSIDARLPQALNDIILMSVTKDPNGRFQSAAAFRNALNSIAGTIQAATQPAMAQPSSAPAPLASPAPFATAPAVAAPRFAPPTVQGPAIAPIPMRRDAMAAAPRSKRGLWMALGGIAAAAAVVGVIEFGPWKGAKANSPTQQMAITQPAQQPPSIQTAQATPLDAPPPQQSLPSSTTSSTTPAQASQQNSAAPKRAVRGGQASAPGAGSQATQYAQAQPVQPPPQQQVQQQMQQPTPQPIPQARVEPPTAVPSGPSREEMMHARERSAKLHVRADAVREGVQHLKRSMESKGMGINGRFTQPEGLMNTYLQGANEALNSGDLPAFREYMEKAERQVEILEKLLNL